MPRTPLMAGNWKMNLNHQEAVALVQKLAWTLSDKKHDYAKAEVVVLPPFTDIRSVQTLVDGDQLSIGYGAHDVSGHEAGPYTGEISAVMLSQARLLSTPCVGHTERRQYHEETDELVNAKATAALGRRDHPGRLRRRAAPGAPGRPAGALHVGPLDGSLAGFSAEQVGALVVADEPVWAIGTGEVATPDDAQEVCAAIRARIREVHGDAAADADPSSTADRSRPPTSAASWSSPTWTAAWSAGPVCRSTSSAGSAVYDMPVL